MKKGTLTMRLFFILTVLSSATCLEVSISQPEYEVARGDDVTFTCTFQPANPLTDGQLVIITWAIEADNPDDPKVPVGSYYSVGAQVDVGPSYEGRASMSVDLAKRESTLTLNKVTMQDSKEFQCRVQIPGDDGGRPADTTFLLVLVAPSVPVISVQGTAEYWNNITLTCASAEGSPKPTYAWQTRNINNVPRSFPPRTTEKDGVLSLFNISMETSGFFICTSTNKIRSAVYNYTLTVMPPSMSVASTAGIVVGVLAGVLVLGLVVFCCYKKKKNDKEEKETPEMSALRNDKPTQEFEERYQDDPPTENAKQGVAPLDQYEERGENDLDLRLHAADAKVRAAGDDGYGDSRNTYDDRRERYGGSRDRLDDQQDRYSESRARGGSRDRLDDQQDRYSESRARGGSRDRLDDQQDRYSESRARGGSRDRLDDQQDRYSESRARGGSRDRLDEGRRYGGSRERLDDIPYHDD